MISGYLIIDVTYQSEFLKSWSVIITSQKIDE